MFQQGNEYRTKTQQINFLIIEVWLKFAITFKTMKDFSLIESTVNYVLLKVCLEV